MSSEVSIVYFVIIITEIRDYFIIFPPTLVYMILFLHFTVQDNFKSRIIGKIQCMETHSICLLFPLMTVRTSRLPIGWNDIFSYCDLPWLTPRESDWKRGLQNRSGVEFPDRAPRLLHQKPRVHTGFFQLDWAEVAVSFDVFDHQSQVVGVWTGIDFECHRKPGKFALHSIGWESNEKIRRGKVLSRRPSPIIFSKIFVFSL